VAGGIRASRAAAAPDGPSAGGGEKFHIHALLHIYINGLLVPLAANIGLDPAKHLESSLDTHDHTGVIHMEAAHPFQVRPR
jgi:hypothetical protein